jgi:hypothetical protein
LAIAISSPVCSVLEIAISSAICPVLECLELLDFFESLSFLVKTPRLGISMSAISGNGG